MRGLWLVLVSLIPYAVFQCGAAGPRLHHCPSVFDGCRFFITVLGGKQWRAAGRWWSFCLSYIATGHWKGCNVEAFSHLESVAIRDLATQRTRMQAIRACQITLQVMDDARVAFRRLATSFSTDVLQSHGNHVPLRVRDVATTLFWLPDILSVNLGGAAIPELEAVVVAEGRTHAICLE